MSKTKQKQIELQTLSPASTLTYLAAARYLNINVQILRDEIDAGRIIPILVGKSHKITVSELNRYAGLTPEGHVKA